MVASSIVMSAIIQGAFKLTLAATAIVVARMTLKWLDWSIEDDSFADTLRTAQPAEKMHYFAARFLGVCIIIGLAIS